MRKLLQLLTRPVVITAVLISVLIPFPALAADDAALTKDQIKEFLGTAEVIKSKQSSKGVTHPWRLTLSNGTVTHDASFQPINEHEARMKLASGKTEFNFVDSYKYNIAAYRLAELLGIDDMLPVYVERKWQGQVGSLSWWLPVKMDDSDRMEKNYGAAIATEVHMGTMTVATRVTGVESKDLPADLFAVPAGYKVEMGPAIRHDMMKK